MAQSVWAEQPSAEDYAQAYALATTPRGEAKVRCAVAADGILSDCAVLSESPASGGFGPIALSLATKFRATADTASKLNGTVVLPIRFGPVEATPPRRDLRFQQMRAYSRLGDAGPYYPDRAARAKLTAVVEADCRVGGEGALANCRIVSLSTPGYGFEFAFLKMAERRWMTAAPVADGPASPPDGVWRFRMIFDGKRH